MPRFLFLAAALFPTQPLPAETRVSTWSEQANAAWWREHDTPLKWAVEAKSIHTQLLGIQERLGTARALSNRNFTSWVRHLKWLTLYPGDEEGHPFFSNPRSRRTFIALAHKPVFRDAFLGALSPYDDHKKALEIFCSIFRDQGADAFQFSNLAIAFSVVFDQPFPRGWPHHFVSPNHVSRGPEDPAQRFAWFVKSHKAGALLYDPGRFSVNNLKFLVDTPVPLKELAYAQQVKIRSPKHLNDLFTTIRYDMPRLQAKRYYWPHGAYDLFSIGQRGGLCLDQAYFTAHTAKAKGVPCIVFLGQGNSGEHAWIGYMAGYGRWLFDLAKFRNEDYPVGQAFDPQSWRRLTDSECAWLNSRSAADPAFIQARDALAWAELNPGAKFHLACLREARCRAPNYLWAWEKEAAYLEATGADPAVRARFWKDWIRSFEKQKDLRFRGEKRLLALLEEAGETAEYNRLLRQMIAANRNSRFDLVISVAAEKVFVHVENRRWEAAHQTYQGAMSKLAHKGGGHLFYQLVQPYVQSCLEEGLNKQAGDAMDRARRAFREAKRGSILEKDVQELAELVKARAG